MTKRLIDIDDRLLHTAQMALGAATYKDTVAQALERAIAGGEGRREDLSDLLKAFSDATADLSDPEVMAAAWR